MAIQDRWVWLGLGAFFVVAAKGISYGLHEVYRLTEVHEKSKEPQRISQETEDSISHESLHTLARSNNIDIRRAAIKIVINRFLQRPETLNLLSNDLTSSNPTTRASAYKAMQFLDTKIGDSWRRAPPPSYRHRHSRRHRFSPYDDRMSHRRHIESDEEQAIRRQRREAFVFNEGDRPISSDDIIQPGTSGNVDPARLLAIAASATDETPAERILDSVETESNGVSVWAEAELIIEESLRELNEDSEEWQEIPVQGDGEQE